MYVIGDKDSNFIIVSTITVYSGVNVKKLITNVTYNTPIGKATVFSSYDEAKGMLRDMKLYLSDISVMNYDVEKRLNVNHARENRSYFGKYMEELNVYELVPTLVNYD
mgnify:CR=1 FL=1